LIRAASAVAGALAAFAGTSAADPIDQSIEKSRFDYLYVRAHEGSASGGHAAVRFGPWVYDFQNQDGLLVPRREDARRFQHAYRTLQNRSIEASRVAASPETIALLRDAFERRQLAQSRQLELAAELVDDVRLLEALRSGSARVRVRGAGFFRAADETEASPASLAELGARIARRHGANWLASRRALAERALRDLAPAPLDLASLAIEPLRYPVTGDSLSRRVAHALAAQTAVAVLTAPHVLCDGACESPVLDSAGALDQAGAARVRAVRAVLLDAAAALAASRRPDWGEALLRSAARLAVLDASLARGRLLLLDALPADATQLPVTKARREIAPALLAEARHDLDIARDEFLAGTSFHELAFASLEAAASRVAELESVVAGDAGLRVAPGALLPEGGALVDVEPRPRASSAEIDRALVTARAAERDFRERITARYGYLLIARNCATELFRTVELALAEGPGAAGAGEVVRFVREESTRRLGGHVDPAASFVPFVSSQSVRTRWRVAEREHLPSAREFLVAREGSLATALRETIVLTSAFAPASERDGFFVFYTDAHWPLRPLLGALNLSAGLARAGVGMLALPFDRGRGLRSGLDGALWSLPELFFANVRKGTSEYVAPPLRPPLD